MAVEINWKILENSKRICMGAAFLGSGVACPAYWTHMSGHKINDQCVGRRGELPPYVDHCV